MEEIITKIGGESVWAGIVVAMIIWFMKTIAQPLTQRHIQFMDTFEIRDRENTEHLQAITADISELRRTQAEHLEICRSGSHPRQAHKPA